MNRPAASGQPQQRPPSLAQNSGINSQFRPPYPVYGMPPRTVNALPGSNFVAGIQSRAPATMATPAFMQQRAQSSFAFGGSLSQHQSTTNLQQQSSSHQTNGASASLPPHLTQTTNIANAQSSTSDVGLDPNDFPALGSTPASNTSNGNSGTTVGGPTTSYASQAGTGVPLGASGAGTIGGGSSTQTRDFTPDDFPALGGQSQAPGPNGQAQNSTTESQSHPPGLNGFPHSDPSQQQHRQNLLGVLGGSLQPGTPGMLNLGQPRNVHPGFQQGQTEAEKQQQRLSTFTFFTPIGVTSANVPPTQNTFAKLSQAQAWNSPNANPGSQSQGTDAFSSQSTTTQPQQNGNHPSQTPSTTHLTAPPGVLPPSYTTATTTQQPGQQQLQSYPSNGAPGDSNPPPNPSTNANPNPSTHQNPATAVPRTSISHPQPPMHPETPAQQVLVSAADRWGLLGLLAMLKNVGTDLDQGMSGIGTDLGTMGLDMGYAGELYSTFITPWADQSAARTVEPDFHLPACYASVQAPPPGPSKASAFSDETLFFMFYSSPRDALQEVAAQELWNRNWRYHKDLRLWITKESGTSPSQKVPGGEQGQYTFWDPENWCKERKDMTVLYADLEEKNTPAFSQVTGLVLSSSTAPAQQTQAQSQTQRGSFQMGL
ncbi:hypothetical protein C0991_011764 [Blastosporella zonata]|nr:hypothetical protein C0991_011764 [Blastosporella zonata]